MKGKVLIAAPVHSVLTEGLEAAGYELLHAEKISQDTAPALIRDCTGVITSTRLQLDRALLDAAPALRWIGRMGSGMEVIDVPYAESRGIRCVFSPEGNSNAVAEHALGMLLGLMKNIVRSNEEVKEGKWLRDANRGYELEGKTVGIIGLGHTGRAFARKLQAFDVRILAYDVRPIADCPDYVTLCPELKILQEASDIISFHVPLSPDTHHYFNEKFLSVLSKRTIVVNTSRGIVVDASVLKRGLEEGKLAGACLDVWEEEPLEKMGQEQRKLLEELVQRPDVVITPHIAGYSFEALYKMSKILLDRIVSVA